MLITYFVFQPWLQEAVLALPIFYFCLASGGSETKLPALAINTVSLVVQIQRAGTAHYSSVVLP
jgi:hypothetical protein